MQKLLFSRTHYTKSISKLNFFDLKLNLCIPKASFSNDFAQISRFCSTFQSYKL